MSIHKYVEFPVGVNKKCIDDVCYELDRETDRLTISLEGDFNSFPDKLAPYLVNRFGLGMTKVIKILTMYSSILLFFLLILEMILEKNSSLSPTMLFFASLTFFVISSYMSEIENYYNISKCKKCGRDFAYEEIKKPLIKMVSTYDKFEKTITRYMKCRYCNNKDIKTEIDYKNSKSKSKKVNKNRKTCKGCGRKLALAEYRYPDVHQEYYNAFRTIKHYKCTSCGYMEISIKYDYIATS